MKRAEVSPGVVVQGYQLERKLGEGGFGQVFLGRKGRSAQALKFIPLEESEGWARRELTLLLYFEHPNVVRLAGHVEWPLDAPEYMVLFMEYVRGRPLYEWAREENPPARAVARVLLRLAEALAAIHAKGALHRDLKGDNVLVREEDGEPVVVDLGSGCFPGMPRVTRGPIAPGTLEYRSPEAVRFLLDEQRPPDARYAHSPADDLYALGVMLYVLLTDEYPFRGVDDVALMRKIERGGFRAPHARNTRVPRALGELCMRLLAREPQGRFSSASELAEALRAALLDADASWDEPLFYGWDSAGRTTEQVPEMAGGALEARPRERLSRRPRRGRKPGAVEAPAVVEAAPSGSRVRSRQRRALWTVAVVSGLLALVGLGGSLVLGLSVRHGTAPPSPPSSAPRLPEEVAPPWLVGPVREVAPPWKPPEVGEGAAPSQAPTPAPVTAVTPRKGEAFVKRNQSAVRSSPVKKGSRSKLAMWCAGAATAACAGSQVRPPPSPQPCPPGAVRTMTEILELPIDEEHGAGLPGWDESNRVFIQPGPVSLILAGRWEKLPSESTLFGHLYIAGERLQGRITEVRTPGGETFPVCMELQEKGERGAEIRAYGDNGTVKVFPRLWVKTVDYFR
ncbi:MAG TPA: serine/threonine-protein kinase [Myxococcaceae bacterium]|nr:serine/threonine-protein kinase [Myxococcaceae bacterium]